MSEKTVVVGDTKIHANVFAAAENRSAAVCIALELIKAACAGQGRAALDQAMKKLPEYTDTIQAAVRKKN